MLPLDLGAGYNSQGVTSSNWAIVKDKVLIVRVGLTWTELSRTSPSAGAGVNSQGVTSSVGPVAVERGYTGTDSYSRLGKGRLGGETGGPDDCLGETGDAGLSLGWEGPDESSQGVTSPTGPVLILCAVEVDENDFFRVDALGNTGTG